MGKKKKRSRGKEKWFLCLMLTLLMFCYSFVYVDRIIEPALLAIAEVKAKSLLAYMVNDAVREKFTEDIDSGSLMTVLTGEDGKVTLVQANTAAINQLSTELTYRIQNKLKEMEPIKVNVPVGSLMGSQILAQVGPSVSFTIKPMSSAKVYIHTEFESTGINQSRHKVYLTVNSGVLVLVPFMEETLELSNEILLAETIIVGDVPETYVYVPEGEVLDAVRLD